MTNSNQIASVKELQIIRNFFTDSQWDVIDAALNEYQDHCEEVCVNFPYDSQEVLDTIGAKLQTVFDKTIKEN